LDIIKILKERHKRTIERKLENGDDLVFDELKGIVNEETGEVVLDIKFIYSTGADDEDLEGDDDILEEEKNNPDSFNEEEMDEDEDSDGK
jgi:hypothetical protein